MQKNKESKEIEKNNSVYQEKSENIYSSNKNLEENNDLAHSLTDNNTRVNDGISTFYKKKLHSKKY